MTRRFNTTDLNLLHLPNQRKVLITFIWVKKFYNIYLGKIFLITFIWVIYHLSTTGKALRAMK